VVQRCVLGRAPEEGLAALTEEDVVAVHAEAGHAAARQPARVLEAEHVLVEALGLVEVVHGYRPVGNAFDLDHLALLTPASAVLTGPAGGLTVAAI